MGGRIGVLVNMEVSDDIRGNDALTSSADIAMQIAAMRPVSGPGTIEPETRRRKSASSWRRPCRKASPIAGGKDRQRANEEAFEKTALTRSSSRTPKSGIKAHRSRGQELANDHGQAFCQIWGEGLEESDNLADEVAKMVVNNSTG